MAQAHERADHHEHGGLDDLHAELDTTPVFEAAREGHVDELMDILDADAAQLHARDKYGLAPLHWACDRGRHHAAALLLSRGADVNAVEKRLFKRTPLLFAALSGNEALVQLLVKQDQVNVAATDYKGWSAAHCAAHVGSVNVLRVLVAAGANLRALTKRKESVLHLAARAGREELISQLVGMATTTASGAEDTENQLLRVDGDLIGAQDEDGNAAADIARANGHKEVAAMLSKAAATATAGN